MTKLNFQQPLLQSLSSHIILQKAYKWADLEKFLKGLFHPKMKVMSLITHPYVIPNS